MHQDSQNHAKNDREGEELNTTRIPEATLTQTTTTERLAQLRQRFAGLKITGFILPSTDAFLNEYVPENQQRLRWLTGFSGSSGRVAITANAADFFTDGRYLLQAQQQLPSPDFTVHNQSEWLKWLDEHAHEIWGFNPWLHAVSTLEAWQKRLPHGTFVALPQDPIDALWGQRQIAPQPIEIHDLGYAGQSHQQKIQQVQAELVNDDAVLLTVPESVAWLLNIRGREGGTVPVAFVRALVLSAEHAKARGYSVVLFADPATVTEEVRSHLSGGHFDPAFHPTSDGASHTLVQISEDMAGTLAHLSGLTVRLDPHTAPVAIADMLTAAGAHLHHGQDPCELPRAIKNATEIGGMRACHVEDGVAVVRALKWLDEQAHKAAQNDGTRVTELDLSAALVQARARSPLFRGVSFPTIAAAGPHGAIIHYNPTPATNATLQPGEVVVIDSGGQYLNGTTDITRTVLFGQPPQGASHASVTLFAEYCDRFTRVLKGHIAIARSRFPKGTTGHVLDALARWWLWQVGCDYAHGTGHGVGSYLNVHEGPQRISRTLTRDVALQSGMVLSNEPGYYADERYGIRIESLLVVTDSKISGDEQQMLAFETITLAPIDRRLLDHQLLDASEIAWLNDYHQRVLTTLAPHLTPDEVTWLRTATRPF